MKGVFSDASKGSKALAKQVAKQVAAEPWEVIKDVKTQVPVSEQVPQQSQTPQPENVPKPPSYNEEQIKQESIKRYQELTAEIEQIRKEKEQKYADETSQEEFVENQEEALKQQSQDQSVNVSTKHSRRMGGQEVHVEKMQKKSEIRMPPSG